MPAGLPNLKKKLEFYFIFLFLFFEAFEVRRVCRHSVGNDTMPTGPPYFKCIKKNLGKKKEKKTFRKFFFVRFKYGGPASIVSLPTLCLWTR
jgi:hypothetical protein